ncbi:hypothetical protein [Desulfosporosinus youngiae]|uniref:Uncharacterized protein n=1 Tax=Desulfosporosinus youngiae DSM 17734 TaxID=768710 RepID=H5XY79_9FIRM|nr:hypothetical protein [Desulfosporosinus youngiae]EHQ91289.1 hypothetical protein DesyoDRAFT_4334 [Desulfosporosinus youngiae DSM 17734]
MKKQSGIKLRNLVDRATNLKIKDSVVLAAFSGFLGGVAMDISNAFLWRVGKSEVLYGHLGGSVFMKAFRTNRAKNFFLGQIFHWTTSAALAIPFFHFLKHTGKDHHLFKGGVWGLFIWATLYNGGQRVGLYKAKPHLSKSHYAAIWHNVLYGLATSWLMVRCADPSLFDKRIENPETMVSIRNHLTTENNEERIQEIPAFH